MGLTLTQTYDITWAEYCILTHAKARQDLIKKKEIRLQAYLNFLAHWNSKNTPPTIDAYMRVEGDRDIEKETLEARKKKFLEAAERHYSKKK